MPKNKRKFIDCVMVELLESDLEGVIFEVCLNALSWGLLEKLFISKVNLHRKYMAAKGVQKVLLSPELYPQIENALEYELEVLSLIGGRE